MQDDPGRAVREREWYESIGEQEDYRTACVKFYAGEAHEPVFRWIDTTLGDLTGSDVLIIGAGAGDIERMIRSGASRIEGIEIAEPRVRMLNKLISARNWRDRAVAREMDAHHLEYNDNSFDLVFASAVIHHLEVPVALAEIQRVLRPGGRAVFVEPLALNPFIAVYRLLTPRARTRDERPLGPWDVRRMRGLFRTVRWEPFYFLALGAFAFRVIWRYERLFTLSLRLLVALDRVLARAVPPLKYLYWIAGFVCEAQGE